ncbi:MAG: GNAT family N-acetyltransferase [Promicromonosporaceae bacterium]|nr:GNAT family N-acetyltransferase [Promicromonosporaceae bacterium]
MSVKPWPVVLRERPGPGAVVLRPLHRRDRSAWLSLRTANHDWLSPWEATTPHPQGAVSSFDDYVRQLARAGKAGTCAPFAVTVDEQLVGQLTVSGIARGSLQSGTIGYWLARHSAGRGVMPTAVAMATDHCLGPLGLHRVEINICPENAKSLRVVEKLGFRDEGVRQRYLHIGGQWRDHRTFALTEEELPAGGLLARWQQLRSS